MIRSFRRGVICSLWLPQSRVLACGNLECMPCSDDYGGGGPENSQPQGEKITVSPLVGVIQSVTKIHFRNKLCKSIVGDVDSIECFCDKCISHSGLWTSTGDLINTVFRICNIYYTNRGMNSNTFLAVRDFSRMGAIMTGVHYSVLVQADYMTDLWPDFLKCNVAFFGSNFLRQSTLFIEKNR